MTEKHLFIRTVLGWLPFAVAIVAVVGFSYVGIQQVYRMSANDPQIQTAEDTAATLSRGGTEVASVIPSGTIAIESSPAPYMVVYNSVGLPVAGNGSLHGNVPILPDGVLESARQNGEHRLTWEPEGGLRQAIVIVSYTNTTSAGFVMVGRSLFEAEKRIDDLGLLALLALAASLVATFIAVFLKEWLAH